MLAQTEPRRVAEGDKKAVLVIHEHDMIRRSVMDVIAPHWTDMRVLACPTLEDARKRLLDQGPDGCRREDVALVLLIAALSDQEDHARVAQVVSDFSGTPVVLLSALHDQAVALESIRQGARGYLSGLMTVPQMIDALRLVLAGGVHVGPMPARNGASVPAPNGTEAAIPVPGSARQAFDPGLLTPRETEVFQHLREGKPNKIIAYELGMSENTVKVHVGRIFKKLGATNRTVIACHHEEATTAPPESSGRVPSSDSRKEPG